MRKLPNIIITGTPGVGKTTTCTQLISLAASLTTPLTLQHLSINDLVKSSGCHSGYDSDLQTYVIEEDDKLLDEVETQIEDGDGPGGWLIDWHSTEGFALRWVDLVVVLRCEDTAVLYDRLASRGYSENKLQENLDVEIFGTVADEAKEGWGEEDGDGKVVELKSEVAEDVEENVGRVLEWIKAWIKNREKNGTNGS